MLFQLIATSVFAAEPVMVEVAHTPPPAVPLFSNSWVTTVKGVHKGDDCRAAAAQALTAGESQGQVLRVVMSPSNLAKATTVPCKKRFAGEDVSASLVSLSLLVVEPEAGSHTFPELPIDRAIQVAGMLSVLSGVEGEMAPIVSEAGKAWVHVSLTADHAPLDEVRYSTGARGARAFVAAARPWLVQWVQVLRGLPEVEGALLEVQSPAHDPRKRGRKATSWETFRYAVSTDSARRYQSGALMTEDLMSEMRASHARGVGAQQYTSIVLEP